MRRHTIDTGIEHILEGISGENRSPLAEVWYSEDGEVFCTHDPREVPTGGNWHMIGTRQRLDDAAESGDVVVIPTEIWRELLRSQK